MEKLKDLMNVKTLAIIAAGLAVILVIAGLIAANRNAAEPTPIPTVTVTATPEATPESEVTPSPEPTVSALYADCTEVWEKLGRPITADDEGFPESSPNVFDLDSDGIGCEDNPLTEEDESDIDWRAIWEQTKGNAEDFADWATPKLKDFWSEFAAPSINNVWEQLKLAW